jgi:hypothetical protein
MSPAEPYTAAAVHYVGNKLLSETAHCIAALVTSTAGENGVTATLFYSQGVPSPGVYATYDANPDVTQRAPGTWHWPADDAPAAAVSA